MKLAGEAKFMEQEMEKRIKRIKCIKKLQIISELVLKKFYQ
jgi:hypothetical protein